MIRTLDILIIIGYFGCMQSTPHPLPVDLDTPLYEQIRRDLEQQIRSGALKPGDQLPSEAELQKMYSVSRTPIRQALDALETAGLIYRAQGRGSFVRERKIGGPVGYMLGFGQHLLDKGYQVERKTLSIELVAANEQVAAGLQLEPGVDVIHVRRRFDVDGEPLVLFNHYVRPIISIQSLRREGDFFSLYDQLQRAGFEPQEAFQSISAVILDEASASLLRVPPASAALLIKQTYYAAGQVPIWLSQLLIRADRYEYEVKLQKR